MGEFDSAPKVVNGEDSSWYFLKVVGQYLLRELGSDNDKRVQLISMLNISTMLEL